MEPKEREKYRKTLLEMADSYRESLKMERNEFNRLIQEDEVWDFADRAEVLDDAMKRASFTLQDRERLRLIQSALYKIDQGTYGMCEQCGSTIDPERLEAIPEAHLCISCKTRAEG